MGSILFTKESMLRFLLASFLLIFCFIIFTSNGPKWKVAPDTYGYIKQEIINPWHGSRSPGLSIFWNVLGVRDVFRNNITQRIINNSDIERSSKNFPRVSEALTRVAYVQAFILAFSFALLFLALNGFVPKSTSILVCLFCICFSPLRPTNAILTDSLATSLSIIFVALTLFWFSKKRLILLFLLCSVSVYAVLLRPDFGFLSLGALILCIINVICGALHKRKRQILYSFFIIGFLCVGTLLWPIWLSIKGGVLVSGQYEHLAKRAFAIHLLEEGDENLFSDAASKTLVTELIKNKFDFDQSLNEKYFSQKERAQYSFPYVFVYVMHPYSDVFYQKLALKYFKWKSLPEMLEQTNNICNPIIRKHFYKYLQLVKSNFLSSMNFYPDLVFPYFKNNLSPVISCTWLDNFFLQVNKLFIFGYNVNFYLFILSYVIVFLGFIVCKSNNLRYAIIFISFLYASHMLIISFNHGIYLRYPSMSQITLLIPTLLSIYILAKRMIIVTKRVITQRRKSLFKK